jgi:hypothetical protein
VIFSADGVSGGRSARRGAATGRASGRIQDRARSAAGVLSTTQTLSDPGKNAFEPRVGVDLIGNAVILWQRFDGLLNRVQARARSVAGALSPTQTIGDTGTTIPVGAQIAVDPQGTAVIVWEHREGTAVCCTRVEARVRATDSTLGLTQYLSAADQVARETQVAVDPTGEAFAVWEKRRPETRLFRTPRSTLRLARTEILWIARVGLQILRWAICDQPHLSSQRRFALILPV